MSEGGAGSGASGGTVSYPERSSNPAAGPRESFSKLLNHDEDVQAESSGSILIVDDKPELLDSLYQLILLNGYEADKALGGEQALDALSRKGYDVVLLDLIMPGVSGHDVLDYASRESLACKIIVVSGDSSFSGVKHALHCGAFDFVKKPYEAGELISTMETALRQCKLESENHVMEEKLKESEELHRFIVNNSPDLVYMLDRNGCFTFVNDRVESLLGFHKEELIGRHYSEIVDEDHLEAARNVFNERRSGERAVTNIELKFKSRLPRQGPRLFHAQSIWMELTAEGVYSDNNERTRENFVGTYGTARDISERKEARDLINFQAYHDLLTHLPNRVLLRDRLQVAIAQARRNKRRLAVMFLDLDRFKLVNDTLGHSMGDRLLKAVANRLQSCLRRGDTLARFGGDEFTLLLPEVRTKDDVVVIAGKILDRLNAPFVIDGHELFVGASIGISIYPEAGESEEALIQNADIAMYQVKGRGKNGYQFFSEEMNHEFSTRLSMERELRNGLAQGELRVFYQPQVSLENGCITGVEALVRWQHPDRGLIQPVEFLPMAEETGLITQIDEFVQGQAFADVSRWRKNGLGDIGVSVNLSAAQLEQDSFVDRFVSTMQNCELSAQAVKLELTENTLMQDMELVIPKLKELRLLGVRIAIDDFGTGYSSLSYLQQFPINTLKIDRSFVGDIRADESDASIINAIVAMARGLKLELIAEGVENRTQLRYLRAKGCRQGQGFIFSGPVDAAEMQKFLEENPFRALVEQDEQETAGAV
jgi:diguanylate cyclase (GGDEF)-like protein/PAS domain S-box-containing protein